MLIETYYIICSRQSITRSDIYTIRRCQINEYIYLTISLNSTRYKKHFTLRLPLERCYIWSSYHPKLSSMIVRSVRHHNNSLQTYKHRVCCFSQSNWKFSRRDWKQAIFLFILIKLGFNCF